MVSPSVSLDQPLAFETHTLTAGARDPMQPEFPRSAAREENHFAPR
jgi:hypothetical protein